MLLFSCPAVLALLALLIVLHIVGAFVKEPFARILNYLNIGLHLLMLAPFILYKFTIEEAVLVYMISVFAYTAVAFLKFNIGDRLTKKEQDAADNCVQEVSDDL
jgi:hypothetical protein